MSGKANLSSGIGDELLMAYADGELDDRTAREVGRAIDNVPALAARLMVFRVTGRALSPHFDEVVEAPPPAAMLNAIRNAPIALRAPSAGESHWGTVRGAVSQVLSSLGLGPSPWLAPAGLAFGLVIGAAATFLGTGSNFGGGLLAEQGGQLIAAGPLARTLESDTMQASQAGPVGVIATFQNETGQWCRLYQASAHAGLACRQGSGQWQIVELGAATARDDTRIEPSEGGGAKAVDDLAASMMASSTALDAETEANLIARGWEAR